MEMDILKKATIRGNLHLTPVPIDVDSLGFDDLHINSERGHGVTLEQAKRFITTAKVSIIKRQGMSENYIAVDGVAYVNPQTKQIKTAFTSAEFDDKIKKVLEEVKKYEQSHK